MISKIFMQKTAKRQEPYLVDMIKSFLGPDWKYVNYINGEEEQFFKENPIAEFPNIIERWRQMPSPSHQADLFKCYYLYLFGGINIDADAMVYHKADDIIKDYSFFSVIGLDRSLLCNGLIGSAPRNKIIYDALKFAYSVPMSQIHSDYHILCKNLYKTVRNGKWDFKYVLFEEHDNVPGESAKSVDSEGNTLFIHYYKYKIIPPLLPSLDQTIIIGPSDKCVKLVTLNRSYKNPKFIINPHPWNDKFTFEIWHNILIVKRTDGHYGWGHNHSVIIKDDGL